MKKVVLCFMILCSATAFADYQQLNVKDSADRLEQLSKTLGNGVYAHPESMDVAGSDYVAIDNENDVKGTNTHDYQDSKESMVVQPEDYHKIGVPLAYLDSKVVYNPDTDVYFEVKDFGDVRMFRLLDGDRNPAFFNLLSDSDDFVDKAWSVFCHKDHITSEKKCIIGKYAVSFVKHSKAGTLLSLTDDIRSLNPRITHYFKVDNKPPIATKTIIVGKDLTLAIGQMKGGEILYTRFTEWDGEQYEEILSLYGFSAAYNYMNMMYARLK